MPKMPTTQQEAFDMLVDRATEARRLYMEQGDPGDFTIALIDTLGLVHPLAQAAVETYESFFQQPIELLIAEKAMVEEAQAAVESTEG